MDLTGEYSDLLQDEAFIKIINELDGITPELKISNKNSESNLPSSDKNLKTQSYSINSTRYDSDVSSEALTDESFNKNSKHWRHFQKRFDLHIFNYLNPLVKYLIETPIDIGSKSVYFTKKKAYLENLVNETVSSYKHLWKEVYLPLCYVSQDSGDAFKSGTCEEVNREYQKLCRDVSLSEIGTYTNCEVDNEFGDEEVLNDVFIENGHRHELVELLFKNGLDYFYHLLDFLLILMDKTLHRYKIVQSLDLITTMIKIMPELSVLLVVPRNKDSKIMTEKKCYFKLLVEKVRVRLNLGPVLDVYTKCLNGNFVPFYMLNPYDVDLRRPQVNPNDSFDSKVMSRESLEFHNSDLNLLNVMDLDNFELNLESSNKRHFMDFDVLQNEVDVEDKDGVQRVEMGDPLATVYVLDRMLNLVLLILERMLEFVNLNISEPTRAGLTKKIKKYLLIPFLGLTPLHELFPPFVGEFEFEGVSQIDYLGLFKRYFYTPPPLYSIRLKFLQILELVGSSGFVKYFGNVNKTNRRLSKSEPVSGMNQRVERVLNNYIHLLTFGSSFVLMGEFMKRSVENSPSFFGVYFQLLPHFRYNVAHLNEVLVIEENVYRIQRRVLRFLSSLRAPKVFIYTNFMNSKRLNLVQDNVMKRILSLLVHYVTGTTNEEIVESVLPEGDECVRNFLPKCEGYCRHLMPYNVNSVVKFIFKTNATDENCIWDLFRHSPYAIDSNSKLSLDSPTKVFLFNDNVDLKVDSVSESFNQKLEETVKSNVNPVNWCFSLENFKDVKYSFEMKPYIRFKSISYKVSGVRGRGPSLSDKEQNLEGTHRTNSSFSVSASCSGSASFSATASASASAGSSVVTERTNFDQNGKSEGDMEGETSRDLFEASGECTSSEGSSGLGTGTLDKCIFECLLIRHMIVESPFSEVFKLRRELIFECLEILLSYPEKHLGCFEPLYQSLLKKLL